MRKIGIVTIYNSNPNYGNKLQNYAIKVILEEMGYNVESLATQEQPPYYSYKIRYLINSFTKSKWRGSELQCIWGKMCAFEEFNRKYLKPNLDLLSGKINIEDFDFFVVGSDQVWNPDWYDDFLKNIYLLTFAKDEQKICLSPSFGVSELPLQWGKWFRDNLSHFKYLSVREEAGADIIKRITGRKAEILIDPTLMLDATQWHNISRRPRKISLTRPYLLTCFLGTKSEDAIADINRYSNERGLEVLNLADKQFPELFELGPCEFIYLIEHAQLVLTDSFHTCVFSFLFQKPFLVYRRQGTSEMISRIDTLLRTLNLERKYVESKLYNDVFEHDYTAGLSNLNIEREKERKYLQTVLYRKEQ